jgi:hypothetical protein
MNCLEHDFNKHYHKIMNYLYHLLAQWNPNHTELQQAPDFVTVEMEEPIEAGTLLENKLVTALHVVLGRAIP